MANDLTQTERETMYRIAFYENGAAYQRTLGVKALSAAKSMLRLYFDSTINDAQDNETEIVTVEANFKDGFFAMETPERNILVRIEED